MTSGAEPVREILQAALNTGAREFVVCAGARNSALVAALASAPEPVKLWPHFEERCAAFFALGRILGSGRPVAVVTTSGTAVAELLPAMIEAHYQGLPLLALTADRPASYRGTGAPQAIEQAGIFGPYARVASDTARDSPEAVATALEAWDHRGPAHVNVCLEEPNASSLPALRAAGAALTAPDQPLSANRPPGVFPEFTALDPVILLGDLLPREIPAALAFALASGSPVYAEAASGLRENPALRSQLVPGGDTGLSLTPHRSVIRLGGVPSCRFWRDLENRPDVPVYSFSRTGHRGLARNSRVFPLETAALAACSVRRSPAFPAFTAGPDLQAALDECLERFPLSEPALFRALSRRVPPDAALFTGNSLPIRQWNLCAAPAVSRPAPVYALRGANGIDGNLSAFLGIAAERDEAWAVVGDLTALYDLAAPWMLARFPGLRARIVVIQNGGGRIFSRLPSLRGMTPAELRLMENPHAVSLEGWARMWGLEWRRFNGPIPGDAKLPDRVVIELHPDAEQTEAFWRAWRDGGDRLAGKTGAP